MKPLTEKQNEKIFSEWKDSDLNFNDLINLAIAFRDEQWKADLQEAKERLRLELNNLFSPERIKKITDYIFGEEP